MRKHQNHCPGSQTFGSCLLLIQSTSSALIWRVYLPLDGPMVHGALNQCVVITRAPLKEKDWARCKEPDSPRLVNCKEIVWERVECVLGRLSLPQLVIESYLPFPFFQFWFFSRTGMSTTLGASKIFTFNDLLMVQEDVQLTSKTIEQLVLQFDQRAFAEFNTDAMKAVSESCSENFDQWHVRSLYLRYLQLPKVKHSKSRWLQAKKMDHTQGHVVSSTSLRRRWKFLWSFATSETQEEHKTKTKVSRSKSDVRRNKGKGG